jgi:branched-chain amino acid transport system permease protein
MNTALLIGQIVSGLITGGGYAVVAIGLSYTLGLARVMNFAFGTFYMLAAFVTAFLITRHAVPYLLAGLATLVIAWIAGWIFSRSVVLPAMKISEPAVMIATLGVGVALTNVAQASFGADVAFITTPFVATTYKMESASVTLQALIVLAAAPIIAGVVGLFMNRTVVGQQIRATAESPSLAGASGIDVPSIQRLAVIVGIVLAALAAILYAPVGVISIFMGDEVLLKAFAITALAGAGRIGGALFVALAVGVFEALFGAFVSTAYSSAAIYALLVVTLVFFPRGLFGGH